MGDLQFYQIPPTSLHRYWNFICEGLIDIEAELHPDWRPEDIYVAIARANAECFVVQSNSQDLGFVIGYPQLRPYSQVSEYFVWCVHTIKPVDLFSLERFIDGRARHFKCSQIGFLSAYFGKAHEKFGYRIHSHYYLKPLDNLAPRVESRANGQEAGG